jgi:hypothetical protein
VHVVPLPSAFSGVIRVGRNYFEGGRHTLEVGDVAVAAVVEQLAASPVALLGKFRTEMEGDCVAVVLK